MMQEVEVLKTIQELICSFFSEEQFTLSKVQNALVIMGTVIYNERSVYAYYCTEREEDTDESGKGYRY